MPALEDRKKHKKCFFFVFILTAQPGDVTAIIQCGQLLNQTEQEKIKKLFKCLV